MKFLSLTLAALALTAPAFAQDSSSSMPSVSLTISQVSGADCKVMGPLEKFQIKLDKTAACGSSNTFTDVVKCDSAADGGKCTVTPTTVDVPPAKGVSECLGVMLQNSKNVSDININATVTLPATLKSLIPGDPVVMVENICSDNPFDVKIGGLGALDDTINEGLGGLLKGQSGMIENLKGQLCTNTADVSLTQTISDAVLDAAGQQATDAAADSGAADSASALGGGLSPSMILGFITEPIDLKVDVTAEGQKAMECTASFKIEQKS